ncbi:MAG: replication-associated recombination protein A [Deltaproteobacteria bacterium]|nr:replication-associated recombination protein A [Deltaproteobacteria bacterium]
MRRSGDQPSLFAANEPPASLDAPLAERMRPRSLAEYVGQAHLVGARRLLRDMVEAGRVHSLILWGPPGSGKTSLARVIAGASQARFVAFSAVLSGVKELRVVIEEAREERRRGRRTILFVDEIHRFNKAQQDAFLPHVEDGTVILIGATTENPSFEIIAPLLSRATVLTLEPLAAEDLRGLIERALTDVERGLGGHGLTADAEALDALVQLAHGDARSGLNILEAAADLAALRGASRLTAELVEEAAQRRAIRYDKDGDEHYNIASAFIKSMRGSDADAALYWMLRMLDAGEDPLFVARRMVIFAAEDVGLADPQALSLAVAAQQAVAFVGLPEGRIPLAEAAVYLAAAPKSNSAYSAMQAAAEDVARHGPLPVPLQLRNAPTRLMKDLGYGRGYQYAHDQPGGQVGHDHLPDALVGRQYYRGRQDGAEAAMVARLGERRRRRDEAAE